MLLSFNKCFISALNAPIYQSVEETVKKKTRKSNLNFVPIAVCVTDHLPVCMYTIQRDSQ